MGEGLIAARRAAPIRGIIPDVAEASRDVSAEDAAAAGPEDRAVRETVFDEELHHESDDGAGDEALPHGQVLGRYILLEPIGEGGMGVVYAAYDPELDRRVALKLLRHRYADDSSIGRARLLREAQAMAKLSHPNVIGVHDVGTVDQQVFIAMELVVGRDLRAWLGAQTRSRDEILDVFFQAGRGLAAAHAVGLIHRDFKPGNVLVGDDGVVRVADFGLARRFGSTEAEPPSVPVAVRPTPAPGGTTSGSLDAMTRTGAVLGTPAYMAPEQHLGRDLDARADQFSYCVALWEAIQGERPFRATHPVELMVQVTRGEITPSARDAAMPAWIRRVLARGLSSDPAARWPGMPDLLAALGRDPTRRRRRMAFAGAGVAGVAAVTYLVARGPGPCVGAEQELARVWSPARAEAIAASFSATSLPFAGDAAADVGRRLDEYGRQWLRTREQVCQAALGVATAPRDTPGMHCIERRRRDLGALVDLLEQADAALVERAHDALGALREVDGCTEAHGFAAVPLPADPAAREAVEGLRDELGRIKALDMAGRWHDANVLSDRLLAAAHEQGDAPLVAEVELEHAETLAGLGRLADATVHMQDAAVWAVQAGHDELLLDAWIALVWHTGVELAQYERSLDWGRYADAMLTRVGRPSRKAGDLRAAQGAAAHIAGKPELAIDLGLEALEIRRREQPGEPIIANTLVQVGNVMVALGRYEDALRHFEEAREVTLAALGPDHPLLSAIENSIGVAYHMKGEPARAEPHWRRAHEIMVGTLGPDHPDLFYSLGNIAEALREQGKYAEALETMRRVDAIQRASLPEGHREFGTTRHNLATLQLALGDATAAVKLFEEAVAMREATVGPDNPAVANSLTGLGEALLALGRHADALPLLERALAIREAKPRREVDGAHTRIMLGRARLSGGGELGAARKLVTDGVAMLDGVRGGDRDRLVAIATAWLAEHAD